MEDTLLFGFDSVSFSSPNWLLFWEIMPGIDFVAIVPEILYISNLPPLILKIIYRVSFVCSSNSSNPFHTHHEGCVPLLSSASSQSYRA